MDKTMKVTVDGVELKVKISEEELAKLTKVKEPKKTGYERVDKGKRYFIATGVGSVEAFTEDNYNLDDTHFKNANYYSDRVLAGDIARADKLMRQLRRFAAENCEEVEWDCINSHYHIYYNYRAKMLCAYDACFCRDLGSIFFDNMKTAQKAIDTFKDELLWYFTEYRDRV